MSKNIWFTGDWHLSHKNVLRLSNRPFETIEEHDEAIINNFNKFINTGDDVYILGDISFSQSYNTYKNIFSILNGNKYIIYGNHDNKNNLIRCQKEGLITSVRESQILNIGSDTIHLYHYPLREWFNFHREGKHLHAHTHCNLDDYKQSVDVGVDCWEMEPVEWSELKEYLKNNCEPNVV